MSLEAAAHKAVHDALVDPSETALAAYIAARIYDRVPSGVPRYPYVVIGAIEVRDDANTCSNASEVHATVHVWTSRPDRGADPGSIEAKQIGGLIRKILAPDDASNLDIDGYHVSVSAFDVAVYRPGDDLLLTEGVLSFTFLVDPTE
jgi:hypothetical protein